MRIVSVIFALSIFYSVVPGASGEGRSGYISSSEGTLAWSFMGVHLLQTFGSINSGKPYKGRWSSVTLQPSRVLTVVVKRPLSAHFDGKGVANLVQSAYETVADMAGRPPIWRVEVYLVPNAYSYSVNHRSWSFGERHSVTYVIPEDLNGFTHTTVRTVAHELFHAWIGERQSSQLENELAAATIEYCAELRAFGSSSLLDKGPINPSNIERLAGSSRALRTSLRARYLEDPKLDGLFAGGEIKATEPQAGALELLCRQRAKNALRSL